MSWKKPAKGFLAPMTLLNIMAVFYLRIFSVVLLTELIMATDIAGMAFLPASVSYLIGTNLFGVLANKMGR